VSDGESGWPAAICTTCEHEVSVGCRRHFVADLAAERARVADLEKRRDELLDALVRLSRETPYPDEVQGWQGQRAALMAEVGTLRARVAELEERIKWLASERDAAESRRMEAADVFLAGQRRIGGERDALAAENARLWAALESIADDNAGRPDRIESALRGGK
jgi:chromosome segregation ATPase